MAVVFYYVRKPLIMLLCLVFTNFDEYRKWKRSTLKVAFSLDLYRFYVLFIRFNSQLRFHLYSKFINDNPFIVI